MTKDSATNRKDARRRAARVKLLVLDVDGVLTDGRILYGSGGEELKAFDIKDGLGIKMLQRVGVDVAIITGRRSPMVQRRAEELGITHIIQGREDKAAALEELCTTLGLEPALCAYMGDDLPDLGAIETAGLGLTVADATVAVRNAAAWQSSRSGGHGAVREACEFLLDARGALSDLERRYQL